MPFFALHYVYIAIVVLLLTTVEEIAARMARVLTDVANNIVKISKLNSERAKHMLFSSFGFNLNWSKTETC